MRWIFHTGALYLTKGLFINFTFNPTVSKQSIKIMNAIHAKHTKQHLSYVGAYPSLEMSLFHSILWLSIDFQVFPTCVTFNRFPSIRMRSFQLVVHSQGIHSLRDCTHWIFPRCERDLTWNFIQNKLHFSDSSFSAKKCLSYVGISTLTDTYKTPGLQGIQCNVGFNQIWLPETVISILLHFCDISWAYQRWLARTY